MEVSELPIYDEFMKVNKKDSVVEVAKKFTKNPEIISIFILDKEGAPEGIIVRDDVLRKVTAKNLDPTTLTAVDIMTSPVVTLDFQTRVLDALKVFRRTKFLSIPVTKKKKMIGVVTMRDLLDTYAGIQKVGSLNIRDEFVVLNPDDNAQEVAKKLAEGTDILAGYVVDYNQYPIGCIEKSNVVDQIVSKNVDPKQVKASALMRKTGKPVEETSFIYEAENIMMSEAVSSLPVVEAGKLVGVITINDLLMYARNIIKEEYLR